MDCLAYIVQCPSQLFAWTIFWMLTFPNSPERKTLFRVLSLGKKFSSAGSCSLGTKNLFFIFVHRVLSRKFNIWVPRKGQTKYLNLLQNSRTIIQFWVYFETCYNFLFLALLRYFYLKNKLHENSSVPKKIKHSKSWPRCHFLGGCRFCDCRSEIRKHKLMCTKSRLQWMTVNFLTISMRAVFKRF